MKNIPALIKGIVSKQARKAYWQNYKFVARWADIKDFEQVAYQKIHKNNLWECVDTGLIFLTVKSACIDHIRKNVRGYRQRRRAPDIAIDSDFDWACDGGVGDKNDCEIALKTMLQWLPKVQRYVVQCLMDGEKQKDIGRNLGLTESRISQIRQEIIDRLFEIHTGKKKKPVLKPTIKPEASNVISFRGVCRVHGSKKVFNKKRGLCFNCYAKLSRMGMLKNKESEYLPYLKRRLQRREIEQLKRTYG